MRGKLYPANMASEMASDMRKIVVGCFLRRGLPTRAKIVARLKDTPRKDEMTANTPAPTDWGLVISRSVPSCQLGRLMAKGGREG